MEFWDLIAKNDRKTDCGKVKMLFLLNTSYFFSGKKKKYLDNFADN